MTDRNRSGWDDLAERMAGDYERQTAQIGFLIAPFEALSNFLTYLLEPKRPAPDTAQCAPQTLRSTGSRSSCPRKVRRRVPSPIASVQEGDTALVVGTIAPLEPTVRAPLSGVECVWYEVQVVSTISTTTQRKGGSFLIQDDTGAARVNPRGAELYLATTWIGRSGFSQDPPPELASYFRTLGEPIVGAHGFYRSLRVEERVLQTGQVIAAFGQGLWERAPDGAAPGETYRDTPRRLRIEAPANQALILTDDEWSCRR